LQGIDSDLLLKVLRVLENEGKAVLLEADDGTVTGVKFVAP
jgi:hypothetical protein